MPRIDGRADDQLREVSITRGFTKTPAGSVLWRQGNTLVLVTASVTSSVPPWFKADRPGGWVTADYVMLPGSTPQRKDWPKIGHTDSRGTEIQRLIGRVVRASIDLAKIGPHTIALDCQVLQADGGTRTASICAASVALADALATLPAVCPPAKVPAGAVDPNVGKYDLRNAIVDPVSAVSVGLVDGRVVLDLDYRDDSAASVDLNVAYTQGGRFVEVQGSAEQGLGFDRRALDSMLDLAVAGCGKLLQIQKSARSEKM